MAGTDDESIFAYVGFATARDIWSEVKVGLLIVAFLGGVPAVLSALFTSGNDSIFRPATGSGNLGVPDWSWGTIVFCGVLWFLRGRIIRVPQFVFKDWLFFSTLLLLLSFLNTMLPGWATWFSFGAFLSVLHGVAAVRTRQEELRALERGQRAGLVDA